MMIFVTSLIQWFFKKISHKKNYIKVVPLLLLFSMPLSAETHYIFPSDIINQTEPATRTMNTSGGLYRKRYPNVLYASDIELNNHLIRQKNKEVFYSFQKRRESLSSVPVPLFSLYKRNASKIQSNTIPDIIDPTDYSHLGSHFNNVGLNTRDARQYDILTSLGMFSEQWD
ncbi:MAG: hypothetical protein GQ546_01950 [Gammaproteobacteria bacterium]|nr:hypothetical protein [Gammaproteobacteria bacterium]